jgi:hypothetical protein
MGGKRFKEYGSVRIPADAAMAIEAEVVRKLGAIGIDAYPTVTFPGKQDYGDLDIVVAEEDLLMHAGLPCDDQTPAHQARQAIEIVLGATKMKRSGPKDHATSYLIESDYGPFQIDLITHTKSEMQYAKRFYAWGDLGALIAMTARRLGLSSKANGLYVVIGEETDRARIKVVSDYDEALTLMGFDPEIHAKGFETQDDAFAWIASGKNFDPQTYALKNLTGKSRKRAEARPIQIAFREWISKNTPATNNKITYGMDDDGSWDTRNKHDKAMLEGWKQKFPQIIEEEARHYARVEEMRKTKQERNDVMSASRVGAKTGLEGKDLNIVLWQMTKHPRYCEMLSLNSEELFDLVVDEVMTRLKEAPVFLKRDKEEYHKNQ